MTFDKLEAYRRMHLIREVEEGIMALYSDGEMRCPVHLYWPGSTRSGGDDGSP